jgi:putative sigma-54 modulation protein
MQLSISGHHLELTNAIRSYVTDKLHRVERHYDHITNVHVVISVNKQAQKAEATLHTAGADIYADADADNLYAAIDSMAEKLDRQLLKHKHKVIDRHHRTPKE